MRRRLHVYRGLADFRYSNPYPVIWPTRDALLGSAFHPTFDAATHPTFDAMLHPTFDSALHPTFDAALHPTNTFDMAELPGISNETMAQALRTTRAGLVREGDSTLREKWIPRSVSDKHALWRWERQARQEACVFELVSGLQYAKGALWRVPLGSSGSHVELFRMASPSQNELVKEAELVRKRTPERGDRLAEILVQANQFWPFWVAVTNMEWTAVPFTFELLQLATSFATPVVMRLKHALACPRPADISPLIQPVIPTPGHGSMPSGHATVAHMVATLLQEVLGLSGKDTTSEQLRRLAARIADNRVVAGLHYPMDSEAGKVLGEALAGYFLAACRDAELAKQMWAASRNELRALKYAA